MTHVLLALMGVILIVLTRKLYYEKFELFLTILVFINFDFFHLVPRLGEFDQYKEALVVVILYYIFEEYFARSFLKTNNSFLVPQDGLFKKVILYMFFIHLAGVIVAFSKGQSLVLGLMTFKYYPLLLVYFIVVKRGLDVDKFTKYFIWLAVVISILLFIQELLPNNITFFYFYEDSIGHIRGEATERGARNLEGFTIISVGVLIAYIKWLKSAKLSFLFATILLFGHLVILLQARAVLLATVLIILLATFIFNKDDIGKVAKYLYYTCGALLTIYFTISAMPEFFSSHGMVLQTLKDVEGVSSIEQGTGSLQARLLCYERYWSDLQENWFFGRGLLHHSWPGNPDLFLKEFYELFLADIGFFHIVVNFGVFGGILLIATITSIFRSFGTLMKSSPEVSGYFLLGLILFPQVDYFFRTNEILLFALFAACVDYNFSLIQSTSDQTVLNGGKSVQA